jgi:hypothetical protein
VLVGVGEEVERRAAEGLEGSPAMRLDRSPTLPKYDITIRPSATEPAVK